MPLITEVPCFKVALTNMFKHPQLDILQWEQMNCGSFLRRHNPCLPRPIYRHGYSRLQFMLLARIRLGKCLFNSRHYFKNCSPLSCCHCGMFMNVPHILVNCPASRLSEPPGLILDCSKTQRISSILKSFAKCNGCMNIHIFSI